MLQCCAQVQPMLADRLQIHMSTSELEEHFLRHRCEQRVVLSSIIRDLLEIVDVAKNMYVCVCVSIGMCACVYRDVCVCL